MIGFLAQFAGRQHRVRILLFVLASAALFCGACADYPNPKAKDEAEATKTFEVHQKELRRECEKLESDLKDWETKKAFLRRLREQIGAQKAAEYLSIRQGMVELREIRRVAEDACPAGEARKDNPAWTRLDVLLRGVENEFDTLDRTLQTIVSRVELENN